MKELTGKHCIKVIKLFGCYILIFCWVNFDICKISSFLSFKICFIENASGGKVSGGTLYNIFWVCYLIKYCFDSLRFKSPISIWYVDKAHRNAQNYSGSNLSISNNILEAIYWNLSEWFFI